VICLTGQGDRGNLRACNGGADGATDLRHIECKAVFAGILPVGRFFAMWVIGKIKPSPFCHVAFLPKGHPLKGRVSTPYSLSCRNALKTCSTWATSAAPLSRSGKTPSSSASTYSGSAGGNSYNAPSRYQSGTPQTFRRNSTTSSPG
jgi:hypothetical protein